MFGASFDNIIFIICKCMNILFKCFKCEHYFKYDRARNVGGLDMEAMVVYKVASLDMSISGNETNYPTL